MDAAIAMQRERRMKAAGMQDVTWFGGSPHRLAAGTVEFSLETRCGAVLRFRMPKDSARMFHDTLGEALGGYTTDQRSSSSGIPSPSGEPKEGHSP